MKNKNDQANKAERVSDQQYTKKFHIPFTSTARSVEFQITISKPKGLFQIDI